MISNKDRWNMILNPQETQESKPYVEQFSKARSEIADAMKMTQAIQEIEESSLPNVQPIAPIQQPVENDLLMPDSLFETLSKGMAVDSHGSLAINQNIFTHPLGENPLAISEELLQKKNQAKAELVQAELLTRENPEEIDIPVVEYKPKENLNSTQKLQEHIIDKGFSVGETGADGVMGRNTIIGIQNMLMDEGYDIGQDKGYGADGILGSRTKTALEDYKKKVSGVDPEDAVYKSPYENALSVKGYLGNCKEGQCAEFVQFELARNTGMSPTKIIKEYGVLGDAWRMANNIRKRGGEMLYDASADIDKKEQMQLGDVVTMYTGGGSDYQTRADAYTGHSKSTSHVGIVDSEIQTDKKGDYFYVLHNVHSGAPGNYKGRKFRNKVYLDDMKLDGYFEHMQVQQVLSPAYEGMDKITYNEDVNISVPEKHKDNNVANIMVSTLNDKDIQKNLRFDLGLSEQEYYNLSQAALGIIEQESKFGEVDTVPLVPGDVELLGKEIGASVYRGLSDIVSFAKGEKSKSGETSLGYGRIKYNTNFKDIERRLKTGYGISKASLSVGADSGRNSIIATMMALGRRYNSLRFKKDISDEEALYLAMQKYNRYDLNRAYGKDNKSSVEYAKDKDLSYPNKGLLYGKDFKVNKGDTPIKTTVGNLNRDLRIIEKQLNFSGVLD